MFNPERRASIYAEGEQVVMTAVWAMVRPATRGRRVVSSASAEVIVAGMAVRRRASMGSPSRLMGRCARRLHPGMSRTSRDRRS
jgi:hypothetical protein